MYAQKKVYYMFIFCTIQFATNYETHLLHFSGHATAKNPKDCLLVNHYQQHTTAKCQLGQTIRFDCAKRGDFGRGLCSNG